ncbi:AI-2E family transporter [Microbacterium sp. H1-D42]|uniref:AI-2E family transporter n=1 Tax=Microbacterium sp. H1-D42 TaxID=2925844 RepID=UPI001F533937|nr:AI-2E family transporter [Microbacterium sp. H1-D42]UNK70289.1 AI-2E family transporter [Microbacterium sp. H1-D42]
MAIENADPSAAPRSRFLTAIEHPLALSFAGALGVLGALVLASAVGQISTILVYIVLAMFVALALDPIVTRLQRHGMKRGAGIAIVFGGFALVMVAFAIFVVPPVIGQVIALVESVPEALKSVKQSDWYLGLDAHAQAGIDSGLAQIADTAVDPNTLLAIGGGVLQVGMGFASFVSAAFIVVALTLYFLASLTSIKGAFYALAPARNRERLAYFTERITGSIGASLIGSVTLSAFNAAAVFVLHLTIGLPFPALMAVIAFVITLIPLFGSVIFLIFASVIALFTSPVQALIFAVLYLVYIQIESYILSPRVMNRAIAIPAALVLIGALAGGALMGVLGVLVALPVIASILLVVREVVVPRQDRKT